MGNEHGKMRLFTPIRSKTTVLPQCASHLSAQRRRPCPLCRGDESAGKRSHRNCSSSPERVRILQPLLPCPQERWRPATYSRSQTPESRPDEKVVQDDHFETDPLANMPRELVYVAGSERRILSHPDSPPSQMILEIRIQRGGLSIQGPAFWAVPGSPHFYTMHGCGSLPSETDGNPHTPSFLGTVIDSVQMTATVSAERATSIQRHAASFKEGTACPLKAFQKMLGLMAVASLVLQLGLLRMQPIQFWLKQRVPEADWCHGRHRITVTRACVSALTRWRNPLWLKQGVTLDTAHRRKVVRSAVRGQTDLRSVVQGRIDPAHQLSRNASSMSGLSILPAGHTVTPCASTLRQQVHGVINKSPGHPRLEATLHAGEQPQSFLNLSFSFLSALFNLIVGQSMPGFPRKRPHCVLCQEKTLVESTQEVC